MILPNAVQEAILRLEAAGYAAYVVGGAVRDWLRGVPPHDFDLCTSARPDQIKAVFAGERVLDTGIRHGTVTVLLAGAPLEITTFRAEGRYSDRRHPDLVRFVPDVETDLARRDFTVNAMAYSPTRGLIDPFGGQDDLRRGILRTAGAPERRFSEDALRILRGLRLMAENGFQPEEHTAAALLALAGTLTQVAPERLSTELFRLLCGRYAGHVLREYTAVLGVILPEILPMKGFPQHTRHHLYDVFEHTMRVFEQIPATPLLRLTALYHDTGKPLCFTRDANGAGHFYGHPKISAALAEQRCLALRLPNALREQIVFLVRTHDVPITQDAALIRRRLAGYGEDRLRYLLMLKKADGVGRGTHMEYIGLYQDIEEIMNQILAQDACLSVRSLALDGHALMALGLRGRAIGEMQRHLLELVLEDPGRNTPDTLAALARQHMEAST